MEEESIKLRRSTRKSVVAKTEELTPRKKNVSTPVKVEPSTPSRRTRASSATPKKSLIEIMSTPKKTLSVLNEEETPKKINKLTKTPKSTSVNIGKGLRDNISTPKKNILKEDEKINNLEEDAISEERPLTRAKRKTITEKQASEIHTKSAEIENNNHNIKEKQIRKSVSFVDNVNKPSEFKSDLNDDVVKSCFALVPKIIISDFTKIGLKEAKKAENIGKQNDCGTVVITKRFESKSPVKAEDVPIQSPKKAPKDCQSTSEVSLLLNDKNITNVPGTPVSSEDVTKTTSINARKSGEFNSTSPVKPEDVPIKSPKKVPKDLQNTPEVSLLLNDEDITNVAAGSLGSSEDITKSPNKTKANNATKSGEFNSTSPVKPEDVSINKSPKKVIKDHQSTSEVSLLLNEKDITNALGSPVSSEDITKSPNKATKSGEFNSTSLVKPEDVSINKSPKKVIKDHQSTSEVSLLLNEKDITNALGSPVSSEDITKSPNETKANNATKSGEFNSTSPVKPEDVSINKSPKKVIKDHQSTSEVSLLLNEKDITNALGSPVSSEDITKSPNKATKSGEFNSPSPVKPEDVPINKSPKKVIKDHQSTSDVPLLLNDKDITNVLRSPVSSEDITKSPNKTKANNARKFGEFNSTSPVKAEDVPIKSPKKVPKDCQSTLEVSLLLNDKDITNVLGSPVNSEDINKSLNQTKSNAGPLKAEDVPIKSPKTALKDCESMSPIKNELEMEISSFNVGVTSPKEALDYKDTIRSPKFVSSSDPELNDLKQMNSPTKHKDQSSPHKVSGMKNELYDSPEKNITDINQDAPKSIQVSESFMEDIPLMVKKSPSDADMTDVENEVNMESNSPSKVKQVGNEIENAQDVGSNKADIDQSTPEVRSIENTLSSPITEKKELKLTRSYNEKSPQIKSPTKPKDILRLEDEEIATNVEIADNENLSKIKIDKLIVTESNDKECSLVSESNPSLSPIKKMTGSSEVDHINVLDSSNTELIEKVSMEAREHNSSQILPMNISDNKSSLKSEVLLDSQRPSTKIEVNELMLAKATLKKIPTKIENVLSPSKQTSENEIIKIEKSKIPNNNASNKDSIKQIPMEGESTSEMIPIKNASDKKSSLKSDLMPDSQTIFKIEVNELLVTKSKLKKISKNINNISTPSKQPREYEVVGVEKCNVTKNDAMKLNNANLNMDSIIATDFNSPKESIEISSSSESSREPFENNSVKSLNMDEENSSNFNSNSENISNEDRPIPINPVETNSLSDSESVGLDLLMSPKDFLNSDDECLMESEKSKYVNQNDDVNNINRSLHVNIHDGITISPTTSGSDGSDQETSEQTQCQKKYKRIVLNDSSSDSGELSTTIVEKETKKKRDSETKCKTNSIENDLESEVSIDETEIECTNISANSDSECENSSIDHMSSGKDFIDFEADVGEESSEGDSNSENYSNTSEEVSSSESSASSPSDFLDLEAKVTNKKRKLEIDRESDSSDYIDSVPLLFHSPKDSVKDEITSSKNKKKQKLTEVSNSVSLQRLKFSDQKKNSYRQENKDSKNIKMKNEVNKVFTKSGVFIVSSINENIKKTKLQRNSNDKLSEFYNRSFKKFDILINDCMPKDFTVTDVNCVKIDDACRRGFVMTEMKSNLITKKSTKRKADHKELIDKKKKKGNVQRIKTNNKSSDVNKLEENSKKEKIYSPFVVTLVLPSSCSSKNVTSALKEAGISNISSIEFIKPNVALVGFSNKKSQKKALGLYGTLEINGKPVYVLEDSSCV